MEEKDFLTRFAMGLLPRKFFADDQYDKYIYEEDQEVSEMYMFSDGKITWAMNAYNNRIHKNFFKPLRT